MPTPKHKPRPRTSIDNLVDEVRRLCRCESDEELFQRATLVHERRKLNFQKAAAALARFLKLGELEHWISKVFHKILRRRLELPRLEPQTA